jgi:hypothetical protein
MTLGLKRMDLAKQIAKYETKGFNRERAEINTLMENAAFTIFRDFPDAFVLFGGATLVLYHDSVRHSADLDLLTMASELPSRIQIISSLERDVKPIAQIMHLGDIRFDTENSHAPEGRISVTTSAGQHLFRVDLTRFGSAIESEIDLHPVELEEGITAVIRSASKELLLLQKAEAFLLRRNVKARDAFDIHLLIQIGATLSANLRGHLQDTMLANEIDADVISDRITKVDSNLCRLELKPILPENVYSPLEQTGFESLRQAVNDLYKEWL